MKIFNVLLLKVTIFCIEFVLSGLVPKYYRLVCQYNVLNADIMKCVIGDDPCSLILMRDYNLLKDELNAMHGRALTLILVKEMMTMELEQ